MSDICNCNEHNCKTCFPPPPIPDETMTLEQLKAEVAKAGYTPSEASWEDERTAHAFSVETFGPDSYNASCYSATFDKAAQRFSTTGKKSISALGWRR